MLAAPAPVGDTVGAVLATTFTPEQLRHLASAMESNTVAARNRRGLSPAAVDELADMLASGRRPTLGWWRRQREVVS